MTTSTQTTDHIEIYLGRLEAALAGLAEPEKDEIRREIRAHILDSAAGAPDPDAAVDRVLGMLGTPEELGERYRTESLLARASRSFSPWLLLRTCWRWARVGMKGTIAFLLALVGYGLALGLTISVFLKPFIPAKVGMWVGKEGLIIGYPGHPEAMHEILGPWFVPVIACAAFAIAVGTTQGLRWMIRKRSSAVAYPMPRTAMAGSARF
jgi:uncharacterized membrane protein